MGKESTENNGGYGMKDISQKAEELQELIINGGSISDIIQYICDNFSNENKGELNE